MNRPVTEREFKLLEVRVSVLEGELKKLLSAVKRAKSRRKK